MPAAADMMVEADLRGVDSHGVSMLPTYDSDFRSGRLNVSPRSGRSAMRPRRP